MIAQGVFRCVKCDAKWTFEDYVCPACDSAAVDPEAFGIPTHEYHWWKYDGEQPIQRVKQKNANAVRIWDLSKGEYL